MKQFKTESKRLLDLMINSIYTNQEIFLRELISNASDASDKLYFKALQDTELGIDKDDMKIIIEADKEKRTLTITDNGIGMNQEDMENYLGTIANSDSHAFKEALENDENNPVDVIGQFGVGFYSAFMVSNKVEVISKAYGEDTAYKFSSSGLDGYQIEEAEKENHGTKIICYLKENTEETNYDEYLEDYTLRTLIRKYSDYIRYPILMRSTDEDAEEEWETINSMIPLWRRSKSDVTDEELNDFYKSKYYDFEDPLKTIQMKVEGVPSFDALLFIPKRIPHNFYSTVYDPGLDLYSRGVYIMENNKDLIPEHFRFVKGLVDSPDLSLNISREILQHDRQLAVISKRIERKIKSELELMLKNDRENYEEFWENFGMSIKYGAYSDYGMNKDQLQDLILFKSSKDLEYVTFKEYVERMPEDQKEIFYVSGESLEQCRTSPQAEFVQSKGYEVLYLTDEIDEFALQMLQNYDEKPFKSVQQSDLDLVDEETKKEIKKKEKDAKKLLDAVKEALDGKVDDVKLSTRLVNHPVCLVSEDGLSFEMEKVLNAIPDNPEAVKAKRILEINPNHDVLMALQKIYDQDSESVKDYASILYDQACLIEGLPLEDPVAFSKKISELMIRTA